jgi:antitoxin component of RelBE/YafQ-DinJ toxin-antitoxin module
MAKLGVPASTVINMLYKQIDMTRSIPFPLSLPQAPMARDEMDTSAFDAMMAGQGLPLGEVLQRMRSTREINFQGYEK